MTHLRCHTTKQPPPQPQQQQRQQQQQQLLQATATSTASTASTATSTSNFGDGMQHKPRRRSASDNTRLLFIPPLPSTAFSFSRRVLSSPSTASSSIASSSTASSFSRFRTAFVSRSNRFKRWYNNPKKPLFSSRSVSDSGMPNLTTGFSGSGSGCRDPIFISRIFISSKREGEMGRSQSQSPQFRHTMLISQRQRGFKFNH